MEATFLPEGAQRGGSWGVGVRLFKDQTCVFGQTQVVDPPVMNDKTPRIDEAISGSRSL